MSVVVGFSVHARVHQLSRLPNRERPDVEVRVEGDWLPARRALLVVEPIWLVGQLLVARRHRGDPARRLHEDDVRLDTVDRS